MMARPPALKWRPGFFVFEIEVGSLAALGKTA
jgi:hypothetical protein